MGNLLNLIKTDWKKVKSGVIQGSVLGPVLFLFLIVDINEYLTKGISFGEYAEDIIAYIIEGETWLNISKSKVLHLRPNPANQNKPQHHRCE